MKLRIIRTIGLSKFTPRWLKIVCLQLIENQIESSLDTFLNGIDESKIPSEKIKKFRKCVDIINLARGKGMQK